MESANVRVSEWNQTKIVPKSETKIEVIPIVVEEKGAPKNKEQLSAK